MLLQGVGARFIGKADAAAFLIEIDHRPASFLCDALHRRRELRTAVAAERMERVACQTLRMDAEERRPIRPNLSFDESHVLEYADERTINVQVECPEFGRQFRTGH